MKQSRIRFQWQPDSLVHRHSTAISLHSHTHHSHEYLDFIHRLAARSGLIHWAMKHSRRRYGASFDLSRCYWTPPLVPKAAWDLERNQIEQGLGLQAIVSLSDHDNIEAPLSLRALQVCRDLPVSVEWTVPYQRTFFHLGVHNLPVALARDYMNRFAAYTASPEESTLGDILRALNSHPEVLIVLNHPLWDESEIGEAAHRATLEQLLRRHGAALHAFELNGLRRWSENRAVAALARAWSKPLISGGDRHGLEPNTLLNLTNASTFAEFVEEIRSDGLSTILVTHRYRQAFFWRIVDTVLDVVGDHENHPLGWKSWSNRVFYLCDDGSRRSLAEIWGNRAPEIVWHFTAAARVLHRSWFQRMLRITLAVEEEVAI